MVKGQIEARFFPCKEPRLFAGSQQVLGLQMAEKQTARPGLPKLGGERSVVVMGAV